MGAPNCSSVSASESDGIPIWCLYVNDSGSVCFSYFSCEDSPRKNESIPIFGRQMVVSTIQTNSDVMKMNKPSESHEGSLQPESPWTHVSVVVDNSNISIYINGNCEVKGSLAPPVIDEKYLAISTLYFGLNLVSGWRLTELRIWADARSGNDIAQNKDNYLALAAKRKRLLLNFTKGPKEKELFLKPNIKPTLDAKPATTTSSIDLILNNTSNPKAEKALSAVEGLSLAIEKPKIQPIKFDAPVGSVSTAAVRRLQAKQSQPQAEEPKQEVAASSLSLNETAIPTILEKETAADSNIIPSLQESLEPVDSKQPTVSSAAAKRLQSKLQKPLS